MRSGVLIRILHRGGRPLDRDLADELTRFFSNNDKEDVIARAKRAYEIYCKRVAGRTFNAELEDLLISFHGGSPSSWTKWHRAGAAIAVVDRLGQSDKLPHARDALYEISLLDYDELRLCLQDTYTRKSRWEPQSEWHRPESPAPVIHPRATAKSIRSWRERWRAG